MSVQSVLGEQFDAVLGSAQEGETWALGRLYENLQPAVLAYLRAQDLEAEDIASDAWIDVARGLRRFTGDEAAFRRWVFTIARRRLIDARRSRTRRRTDPVPPEWLDSPVSDNQAERLGSNQAARDIVAVLPELQAQVVMLRVVAGFDVDEVAEILDKRPGAVRALQHRALRRLAKNFRASRNASVASDDVTG
jgi:RNA polymerase sigma-70 factor (ECF subfamily)